MATEEKPTQVEDDVVVTIEYKLLVDGEILDSTDEEGPLDYLQGHDNIIQGLEKELAGMKVGDAKKVTVSPEDGYGDLDPNAIFDLPRDEFPDDVPLEEGIELEITDHNGEVMLAKIVGVGEEEIRLDTNHPLAGKTLHFEVTIKNLRKASPEEIDHGHAHFGDGHHH